MDRGEAVEMAKKGVAEPYKCPICGSKLTEITEFPDAISGVPFPFNHTVESIWESARLKLRFCECPKCGLLLAFRRKKT